MCILSIKFKQQQISNNKPYTAEIHKYFLSSICVVYLGLNNHLSNILHRTMQSSEAGRLLIKTMFCL